MPTIPKRKTDDPKYLEDTSSNDSACNSAALAGLLDEGDQRWFINILKMTLKRVISRRADSWGTAKSYWTMRPFDRMLIKAMRLVGFNVYIIFVDETNTARGCYSYPDELMIGVYGNSEWISVEPKPGATTSLPPERKPRSR
jgi:hypothetical protein